MKKFTLIALTLGIFYGFNSCCTDTICLSEGIYEMDFYNFPQTDLDTIRIIGYNKNTNFATPIDTSIVTKVNLLHDSLYTYAYFQFNTDRDFKIKLYSTGQAVNVTNIQIGKEAQCNTCFPFRITRRDSLIVINSYSVNGQKQTDGRVKIYK